MPKKSATSSAGFKRRHFLFLPVVGRHHLFGFSAIPVAVPLSLSFRPGKWNLGCLESRGLTQGKVIVMPLERKNRNPCCVGSVGVMTDFYMNFAKDQKMLKVVF